MHIGLRIWFSLLENGNRKAIRVLGASGVNWLPVDARAPARAARRLSLSETNHAAICNSCTTL